jgi:hypothetical protein
LVQIKARSRTSDHIANTVREPVDSVFLGTIGAAEDIASDFHSVTKDAYAAVLTDGREGMNCALETIEYMNDAVPSDFEALVVIVATHFTSRHDRSLVESLLG